MSVYVKEKIKLSILFIALVLTIIITTNLVVGSILRTAKSIDNSLKHINKSQDEIIGIIKEFKHSNALNN